MEVTYSELRARARQSLKGFWGGAVGATAIYLVIQIAIQWISGSIPILGSIISLLVSGAFMLGLISFFMSYARGNHQPVSEIFYGFKHWGKALLLTLLIGIFTFLWALLLIIPGIIASFRYVMAYYILRDHPEISSMEAIRRSKALMVGHKWRFFVLGLTFIGWALLSLLTLGIGFLWLNPYIQVTTAHFYDDLLARQERATMAFPPSYGAPVE